MHGVDMDEAIARILQREPKYAPEAYHFLREALDHTVEMFRQPPDGPRRHVTGRELCEGFRDLALQQFGPLAARVLREWGVTSTEDIGAMVFQLVAENVLLASPEDRPEDFVGVYDFDSAFKFPFLPRPRPRTRRRRTSRRIAQQETKHDRPN